MLVANLAQATHSVIKARVNATFFISEELCVLEHLLYNSNSLFQLIKRASGPPERHTSQRKNGCLHVIELLLAMHFNDFKHLGTSMWVHSIEESLVSEFKAVTEEAQGIKNLTFRLLAVKVQKSTSVERQQLLLYLRRALIWHALDQGARKVHNVSPDFISLFKLFIEDFLIFFVHLLPLLFKLL